MERNQHLQNGTILSILVMEKNYLLDMAYTVPTDGVQIASSDQTPNF